MPRPKGIAKTGGRKAGVPNKKKALLGEAENSLEEMRKIARGEVACRTCHGLGKTKYQPAKGQDKYLERTCESCYGSGKEKISPELSGKMWSEVAQYEYAKKKQVEVSGEINLTLGNRIRAANERIREHGSGSTG